jgi:hypothetical protein
MRLVEARGDSTPGGDAGTAADPIPDVRGLLDEIAAAGFDPDRQAVISFHLHFPARSGWELAANAAQESWRVSAYSRPGGHMLQLSRETALTESDLERERAAVVAFATEHGGLADSVTVEETAHPNTWRALAAQQAEAAQSAEADEPNAIAPDASASGNIA